MRVRRWRAASGVLLVALVGLLITGCGQEPDTKAEPESTRLLRPAVVAFKDSKTVRASFTFTESGGSILGREVSGDAGVVVGTGDMSVEYTDKTDVYIGASDVPAPTIEHLYACDEAMSVPVVTCPWWRT